MSGALGRFLLAGAIFVVVADVRPSGPVGSEGRRARTESLLMIGVQADSVDFRLIDPIGRVAVIAVDSAASAIPGCTVEKSSWIPDHDDSNWDPDSVDSGPYGGGSFTLEDPQPGVWHLDALAARGCEDSCFTAVVVWSMKHVSLDWQSWLRPGEGVRLRLSLDPLARREGRVWAQMDLEVRASIQELGSRKPRMH